MQLTSHSLLLLLVAMGLGSQSSPIQAEEKAAKPSIELPATDDGLPGAGPIRRYDWFKNLWTEK